MELLEPQKSSFSIFPVLTEKFINHSEAPKLVRHSLSKQLQQKSNIFFLFFTENLTLPLPISLCAGHNTKQADRLNNSKFAEFWNLKNRVFQFFL